MTYPALSRYVIHARGRDRSSRRPVPCSGIGPARIDSDSKSVSIANGSIRAIVAVDTNDGGSCLLVRFVHTGTGEELLAEQRAPVNTGEQFWFRRQHSCSRAFWR